MKRFLPLAVILSLLFLDAPVLSYEAGLTGAHVYGDGYYASFDETPIYWQSWRVENSLATIVLVHGYGSSSNIFASFAKELNEIGVSAYAMDLRGHGRSGGKKLSVESFEDYIKDLEIFLNLVKEQRPAEKLFLLGHSLGGGIALRYSMEKDVDGIIASAPAVGMQLFGHSIPLWTIRLLYPLLTLFSRLIPEFTIPIPAIKNNMNMRMLTENAGNMIYLWENAGHINAPCLFVIGNEDQVVPLEDLRVFYNNISSEDKSFSIVEGADHFLFNENNTERTSEVIMGWLFDELDLNFSPSPSQAEFGCYNPITSENSYRYEPEDRREERHIYDTCDNYIVIPEEKGS